MLTIDLKQMIRSVPDFPKPGINFFDITTLLKDPNGLQVTIDSIAAPYSSAGIHTVVGIESRGYHLGSAVAQRIGAGFVPMRKPGKLPAKTLKEIYDLEYGKDALENPRRRDRKGSACAHRGRCAGDGRNGGGSDAARAAARGRAEGVGVSDRAHVPRREGEASR
jgi:adenine/guanine phosphoribosyltransferase-like PRPP-binding protein